AIRDRRLPPPDLLKIDVEGFELEVLRGASATLRSARPRVFVELHGLEAADRRRNVSDIVSHMRGLGYPPPAHLESGATVLDAARHVQEGHLWFAASRKFACWHSSGSRSVGFGNTWSTPTACWVPTSTNSASCPSRTRNCRTCARRWREPPTASNCRARRRCARCSSRSRGASRPGASISFIRTASPPAPSAR